MQSKKNIVLSSVAIFAILAAIVLVAGNFPKTPIQLPIETLGTIETTAPIEVEPRPLDFSVQYVRTDGYREGAVFPVVRVIRSRAELVAYCETYREYYDFSYRSPLSSDLRTGFLTAIEAYDETYFAEHILLMVLLEEGSGSISHKVTDLYLDENGRLTVNIDRVVPENGTCDMAEWHILVSPEAGVDADGGVLLCIDGDPTAAVVDETPLTSTRKPYDGVWIEKNDETRETLAEPTTLEVVITEIYADCFFARMVIPMPTVIKCNCILSHEWCVDDQISITCENLYYDEKQFREEVDVIRVEQSEFVPDPNVCYKPVIYLYPEKETEVTVTLTLDGRLTCTYPIYADGWTVTARPSGTLTDEDGREYNYLYWEGEIIAEYDFSRGFCVRGEDTAAFLEEALEALGLTRREANEFIVYWLPQMQENPYNIIAFQTEAYTDAAELAVDPAPDTLIRVFMAWQPTDVFVPMEAQELSAPERVGFTVVEWGGARTVHSSNSR